VFSTSAPVGFLPHAAERRAQLAAGTRPAGVATAGELRRLIFNDWLDACVAGCFMLAAVVILLASAREWWLVASGRKAAVSSEVPFAARPAGALAE
jgi:carbon starvation protein